MLNKIKNRNQQGFTIIEVLIVLAIAGLIMVIVFLAVPALNRSSRNASVKNDASAITGGVSEFSSNNNGAFPTTIAKSAGSSDVAITGAIGTIESQARVNGSSDVETTTSVPSSLTSGQIRVFLGKKCNGSDSTRAIAVYYAVEKASGAPGVACLDS